MEAGGRVKDGRKVVTGRRGGDGGVRRVGEEKGHEERESGDDRVREEMKKER